MFNISILIVSLLCVPLVLRAFRGTFLEISWKRRSFAGLIIGKEIFLLIVPGVLMYTFELYKSYRYFFVTENSIKEASFYILYALIVFVISFSFISRVVLSKSALRIRDEPRWLGRDTVLIRQMYSASILSILAITALLVGFGMKHAFITSLLSGVDLMSVRLQNRYSSGVPTVIMSMYRFLFVISAVLYGLNFSKLSLYGRIFGFLVIVFAITFLGDKAPVFSALVLMILANLSVGGRFPVRKIIKLSVVMGVISLSVLYAITYVQFGGINLFEFFEFLIARAGLGQISGVYEQFAIRLHNPDYVWHSVPFANLLLDYPVYNKDLMMRMWGADLLAEETGVVNSFFIGEAFAIGGLPLVLISPILVALNYCLAILCLSWFCRRFFGLSRSAAHSLLQLLIPSIFFLTGDIAGILFGKTLVLALIFLMLIWFVRNFLYLGSFRKSLGPIRIVS